MKGDCEGEFTFGGGMGVSFIDLCSVLDNILHFLCDFKMWQGTYSDHMPIVVSINFSNRN